MMAEALYQGFKITITAILMLGAALTDGDRSTVMACAAVILVFLR